MENSRCSENLRDKVDADSWAKMIRPTHNFYHQEDFPNHRPTPLYIIDNTNNSSRIIVYNTENGREETQTLDAPVQLNWFTCITQLPNDELFCFGRYPCSGIALIINTNYEIKILPPGTPCYGSSWIYFNNRVYCFGGANTRPFNLSTVFDLNENRWIKLNKMPKTGYACHSVIFHRNILISGYQNINLLLYSIDLDSFSIIPYDFAKMYRKILINVGRLYLIECSGLIYESEDEYIGNKYHNL